MNATLPHTADLLRAGIQAECEAVCLSESELRASMLQATVTIIAGLLEPDWRVKARAIGIAQRWVEEGKRLEG